MPVVAGIALASGGREFVEPLRTTAQFHDVETAIAAGYSLRLPDTSGMTCIADPTLGTMGVHMVNTGLLDAEIDASSPEALVYEPGRNGQLKLVAVEYVVFQSAWAGSGHRRSSARYSTTSPAPNRYGLPPSWALHAWIWKPNPSGILFAWNPRVELRLRAAAVAGVFGRPTATASPAGTRAFAAIATRQRRSSLQA